MLHWLWKWIYRTKRRRLRKKCPEIYYESMDGRPKRTYEKHGSLNVAQFGKYDVTRWSRLRKYIVWIAILAGLVWFVLESFHAFAIFE